MKKTLLTAATLALFAAAGAAHASTDGSLSTSQSTGTVQVSAVVVPMVRVTGLDDLNLSINPQTLAVPGNQISEVSKFCVYSNVDAQGSYRIQVLGNRGEDNGNPYGLLGQNTGSTLSHTVFVDDKADWGSTTSSFVRQSTVKVAKNTTGNQQRATTTDCSGNGLNGSNASLAVRIRKTNAYAALADTYTGTLTVVVSVP